MPTIDVAIGIDLANSSAKTVPKDYKSSWHDLCLSWLVGGRIWREIPAIPSPEEILKSILRENIKRR